MRGMQTHINVHSIFYGCLLFKFYLFLSFLRLFVVNWFLIKGFNFVSLRLRVSISSLFYLLCEMLALGCSQGEFALPTFH